MRKNEKELLKHAEKERVTEYASSAVRNKITLTNKYSRRKKYLFSESHIKSSIQIVIIKNTGRKMKIIDYARLCVSQR